jgi:hypothetical protein
MKKTFLFLVALTLVIYFSSCRKCYYCHNNCVVCYRLDTLFVNNTDSIQGFRTDTSMICSDSYTSTVDYLAAISADTSVHFKCVNISPTYSETFCSYHPGQATYPNYFNEGGRAQCDVK